MSDAVNKFVVSAKEALDELNHTLLSYEGDTSDLDNVDSLFKCVHSLNGEASYIGHEQLVEFSEEFKYVLSLFRKGIEAPNQDQFNVFFKAVDLMNKLVEQVENGEIVPIDLSYPISELHALTAELTMASQELPPAQEEPKEENIEPEKSFEPSPIMLEEANKQLLDPDMSIVVDACLIEAQDLFEELAEKLTELGSSPSNRAYIAKSIIKGLKSLRSSAGFLSLEQISTQAKYLQLLLKELAEGKIEWIDEFHDLLYAGFSQLHALILQVKAKKLVAVDYNNLVSALDKASKGTFKRELLEGIPLLECGLTMAAASQPAEAVEEIRETEPIEAQETSFYVGPDHPLYSDGMQEIVESFIVETGELFDDLDNKLLELEHNYKDEALVSDIFRAVHTIKGSAGFLSLDQLNQLAHHFEDVLNQLRRGGLAFHSGMLDIMFEAFDLMKVLQQQVIDMKLEEIDTTNIVKQLKLISEGKFEGVTSSRSAVSQPASAPAARNAAKSTPKRSQDRSTETIRVEVERLDSLMNLVGELVLNRNRLVQIIDDVSHVLQEHDDLYKTMLDTSSQLDFITTELQTGVMHTRMVQVGRIFNKFPRVVRDLAKDANKMINLVIEGAETELDKSLTEEIGDPLVHLIRNSVDHGIEPPDVRVSNGKEPQGSIRLSAQHEGNNIVIEIEDDGKGMDPEKLKKKAMEKGLISDKEAAEMSDKEAFNLIFKAGFSTAETVTKISGRGVGMDVVKTNIAKMNGTISINSELGVGTVITLKLPLTLAINQSLLVRQGDETFAIPLHSVIEVVNLTEQKIDSVNGQEVIQIRERILPLVRIGEFLDIPNSKKSEHAYAVIVGLAHHRIGLVADDLVGQKEIVIKPLGSYLKQVEGIAGSTILGDGHVIMILDVAQIIRSDKERQRAAVSELEMAA